jgi:hypothetical protein
MSQLTALQLAIKKFKSESNLSWESGNYTDAHTFDYVVQELTKLLETEQNQMQITENTSDGYHTFKTLYEIRKAYNVALFNEWGKYNIPLYNVHKSRKHYDGEYPFGKDNWFIVCAELPNGQISNHYTMDDWDLFKIPETEKALFPFDGHTTEDVIDRLLKINK